MLDPGLFLLDEPTANLAPIVANALLTEHVRQLATSGAAVLIVEQRAKAVLAISDRSYVLGGGEVRMAGTPAELSARPDFIESFPRAGRTIRVTWRVRAARRPAVSQHRGPPRILHVTFRCRRPPTPGPKRSNSAAAP